MPITAKQGFNDEYFASLTTDDCISACKEKVSDFVNFLVVSGRLERWQRNYANYYGTSTATPASSNKLSSAGYSGEYTTLKVNDYRNLLTRLVVMTTQGRPALKAKAGNNDVRSQTETIIAESLLEYGLRDKHAETDLKRAVELALLYDDAFLLQLWNANIGDDVAMDPDTGAIHKAGDVEQHLIASPDVVRDPNLRTGKSPWFIIRLQKNRFDLAAQFSASRDEILACDAQEGYLPGIYTFAIPNPTSSKDLVDAFILLHEKTPAVPNGRLLMFVGDVGLIDCPLPYDEITMGRICQAEQDQTPFGYSNGNDLLSLEEGKDALLSIILSNEVTFGGQNIASKKGNGITWSQLGEGFNLFELDNPQTDIVPLQLAKTAPELFNFVKMLDNKETQLAGLNQTVIGNPEKNIASGSAMALIEAQAIQFISGLQESYTQLLETWGNHRIQIYQQYADEPRVVDIIGKANRSYIKSFKWNKDDIASVKRVKCEVVSALSKTYSGKLTMAQDMLKSGLIKRPDQYFTVIETGQLEPLFHDELTDLIMIAAENEALQEGKPVIALITDLHKEHILAHRSLLNDPDTRINDPDLRQRVTNHMLQHYQLAQQMGQNPILAWATGQPLPPPTPLPGPGPGAMPQANAPHPPNGGALPGPQMPGVNDAQPPVERQAQGVAMPSMPKNPSTNERAPIAGPGQGPTSGT